MVDGQFDNGQLIFWDKHGVVHPIEGKKYHIREVRNHTNGKMGFILEEIDNPKVPIQHGVMGVVMMDVTFAARRFRTLAGLEITKEMLRETIIA